MGAPAPDLLRLLRSWGVTLAPVAPHAVGQRLADTMGWMDAVALAQALGTTESPAAPDAARLQTAQAHATAAAAACRTALLAAFADPALVRAGTPPGSGALEAVAPFRQHHVQQQRAMAARVPALRAALREHLGASPRLSRLAELDAVLESTLHDALQQRLAALPSILQQRGVGLRASNAGAPDTWPPQGWRRQLWADLQRLLQAELALRWQPLQGLLEALTDGLQDELAAAEAVGQPAAQTTAQTTTQHAAPTNHPHRPPPAAPPPASTPQRAHSEAAAPPATTPSPALGD